MYKNGILISKTVFDYLQCKRTFKCSLDWKEANTVKGNIRYYKTQNACKNMWENV